MKAKATAPKYAVNCKGCGVHLPAQEWGYPYCDACNERQHEAYLLEKAERDKNREAHRLLQLEADWKKICPPLFLDTESDRLPCRQQYEKVMAWQYNPKGLILLGESGTGKTRCVYELLHRLHMEGRSVAVIDCIDFGHEVSIRFGNFNWHSWLSKLANANVLFIDDFGKEALTERVESELFYVVNFRTAQKLPIIISTNMATGEQLEARMTADRGKPLVRRLREFCEPIVFKKQKTS